MSLVDRIREHRRRKLKQHLREVEAVIDGLSVLPRQLTAPELDLLDTAREYQQWIIERLRKIGD